MFTLDSILLVVALSLDAFVASIAYGTNKIKIPFLSTIIINITCSFFLIFSLFLGRQVSKILPKEVTIIMSFTILMGMGIYYLFEGIIKTYLKKKSDEVKKVRIKLFQIWFIIDIYVDETKADLNLSKDLSSKEALFLATALSLDSIAVGFGSSLVNINYLLVVALSIVVGMFAVRVGLYIGNKLVNKTKINLSWFTGIILIILALLKLK